MRIETSFGAEGPTHISVEFLVVDVLYEINRERVAVVELPMTKLGKCIDAANEAFKQEWVKPDETIQ